MIRIKGFKICCLALILLFSSPGLFADSNSGAIDRITKEVSQIDANESKYKVITTQGGWLFGRRG